MKLFSILKKIKRYFLGPKTEIEFVEASLQRHRQKLEDLDMSIGPGHCCVTCATAGQDLLLARKIERIEHRLQVLRERKRKK